MNCDRCDGKMMVMKTFNAGSIKTQERRCNKCRRTATYIIAQHDGAESAYMLARRLRAQQNENRRS